MSTHPAWCVSTARNHPTHRSESRTIDDTHVWMLQSGDLPRIFVGGVAVDVAYAETFAHLLARLGHAELAGAVRKLGELHRTETDSAERNRCAHCGAGIHKTDGQWYHTVTYSIGCSPAEPGSTVATPRAAA